MLLKALSFLAGVMFVQQLAELPNFFILLTMLIILLVIYWRFLIGREFKWLIELIIFVLFGASWICFHAADYLDHKLPEQLAGQEFYVEGVIEGIPLTDDHVQRFMLDVEQFEAKDKTITLPERLRLSWYYGVPVNAGEHCVFWFV